jgi:flavin prenyltransferase
VIYGIRLLEVLRDVPEVETHLVLTSAAKRTIALETDWRSPDVEAMADVSYRYQDIAAAISSGSYPTAGMVVAPCSMNTLSEIAISASSNLLTRAADVTLKERRRLILMPREAPLHLGHLRLMAQAAEIGAVICPPMPSFYTRPTSIAELVDHSLARVLDLLSIDAADRLTPRWAGPKGGASDSGVG